ncbi:MAG: hypothetical protein IAF08_13670 [Rhizobacter sp.]|nr:hypothetical protein [Chlorobiales bacterium]
MPEPSSRLRLLKTFEENKENAYTADFSAQGERFAAGGGQRSVFIYDTNAEQVIGGLADHKQSIYAVAFSQNGKWFFSTGRDGLVKMYNADTFDPVRTWMVLKVGQYWLSINTRTADGHETTVMHDAQFNVVFEKDTTADRVLEAVTLLLYANEDRHGEAVRRSNDTVRTLLPEFDPQTALLQSKPNFAIALSPDSETLVLGGTDGVLRLYETATGNLIRTLALHSGNIRTVACSHDGRYIATGSSDRLVKILDARSLEVVNTIEGHGDTVFAVRFSANDQCFATAGKDARVRLWNMDGYKLKPLVKVTAHTFSINAIAFLDCSKELITVSQDKTIKLWDVASMTCLETIDRTYGGHAFTVNSVAISPDEKRVLTASDDKTVKLWQLA